MCYALRSRCFILVILVLAASCTGHGGGSGVIPSGALQNRSLRPNAASSGPQLVQSANGAQFSASSISITLTSVPASGDVLVVFFSNNGTTTGSAITYTPPSGWTQIDVDTAHSSHSYSAFYHVAGTSESKAYAFTPSCVCRETTWMAAEYANVNTAAPIDAHGFSFVSNTTSWATPALTPKQAGDLAVVAMMPSQFSLTWSNAAGWTVDLGPTTTWSQELLQEAQSGTAPVSEASTLSGAGFGYAAIVLLAPATQVSGSPPPTPTPSMSPTPSPSTSPGAIPQLAQSANGAQFAASTIAVAFKSVPMSGHVLVIFFSNNGTTAGSAITYTAPAGWTHLDVDTAHSSHSFSAFYHVTGSGESNSYIFTPSCACRETSWIAADYANVNPVSPIDGHGFNFVSNSTLWTTPSKTPAKPSDLAAVAMMPSQFSLTWSNASGWTVDLGPTSTWSQELLQQAQPGTSTVSEASTLSGAGSGYAAIVLLSSSGAASSSKVDWDTWGMKPTRNSYNPVETTLTTSNVSALHQHWATNLSGVITDAPVLAANVPGTNQGTVDLLFVGDANANFYAMNAQTGTTVWQRTLNTQVIDGNATATLGCFDQPGGVYGIGGSATIDRSRSLVYVVDALGNLYGFDLATGTQKTGPVAMWPFQNGVNITNDYGALNEDSAAGVIYVPGGAHCGLANYGGMQTYNLATGVITHFYTEGGPPNVSGGVWGPGGAVIDPRVASNPSMNNVYFGTAFGPLGTNKHPYSVVRLTESLQLVAANNPVTTTCCPDLDFGGTPLVFTPTSSGCGTTLVAAESKNGVFYVYNAAAINSGPIQSIQLGTSTGNGINLGTAAYDPTKNLVFIQNGGNSSNTSTGLLHGLVAFTVTSSCMLQLAWQDTIGPNQLPDGPPAPPTVANGVVYYVDGPGPGNCSPVAHTCTTPSAADFYALNETNGAILFHTTLPVGLFTAPVVVNGTVYLTDWNGEGPGIVYAFGL